MPVPERFPDRNICIIGFGYVGLTLGVAMANAGFRVHGVERNRDIVDQVRNGCAHFTEIGLNEKLVQQIAKGRLSVSERLPEDPSVKVYIITVGTPIGPDKRVRYDAIKVVLEDLARVLKDGDLVVLRSTVVIGTTCGTAKQMLDKAGKIYDLAFCPERTLEGRALLELRTLPQIVGGINDSSTVRASQLFSFLTPSVVRVRNPDTAEMIKLVNNTQRDVIFAFANEVAAMCDAVGVSASEVISTGNLGYPRANLPSPGPVGGPCLEKDPYILAEGLRLFGFEPGLSMTARLWNENLPQRSVQALAQAWRAKSGSGSAPQSISILGLAFKGRPETDDLRGTLAIPIIDELKKQFPETRISGFDPVVTRDRIKSLGVTPCDSLESAFHNASIVVIQNNHQIFAAMEIDKLAATMMSPGVIYDYWSQHEGEELDLPPGIVYGGLGNFTGLE